MRRGRGPHDRHHPRDRAAGRHLSHPAEHRSGQSDAEAREEIPTVAWTEEEKKFADEINRTSPLYEQDTPPFDDAVRPLGHNNGFASTDYGDVMHICPGIQNSECTAATLSGGHSWMITACSGSSIGMKGMLRAGKVMAAGAYKMIENPERLAEMKAEFDAVTKGKPYVCRSPMRSRGPIRTEP